MNRETQNAVYVASTVLAAIYLLLFYIALDGYGYSGYRGFSSRASHFYWGNTQEFHERSNRAGSIGGANPLGGGPESGK